MTNYNLTQQRINFPWRNKPRGVVEFNAIMNLMEQPGLLIESKNGFIWGANPAFGLLSGHDTKDLVGTNVGNLFTGVEDSVQPIFEQETAFLLRKNREQLPVNLKARSIEGNQQLHLLLVSEIVEVENQKEPVQDRIIRAFSGLTDLSIDGDFNSSMTKAARLVQEAINASHVCVYQADPAAPRLIKAVETGDEPIFPEAMSSTNLIRLSKVTIWQEGKRLVSDIHHAGREHKLQYVGSAPLGQSGKLFGVVVVAGMAEPYEKLTNFLEIIAAQITRFYENYMLAGNLQREIVEQQQSMTTAQVVMDNVQEGVLVVAPSLEMVAMNPAAEWMLGYAEWEVKGKRAESILIGPEGLVPALEAAVKGIPTHNIGNVNIHRRNGQSFPAHIQTIPIGKEGEVAGLVVLITDISENEEIRIRTQQLEQRAVLGEVSAVFAHEVKNPINNIYTGLQLLDATLPPDDPNHENLALYLHDCVRLTHLMESVLNFSRNTPTNFEAVDLKPAIQRLIDRWRPRFAKVNVTSFFQVEPGTPLAYADPRGLEQVFTNLISNATEAMSKTGGNLALRIAPRNVIPGRPQVVVTVSDDGPGIPAEVLARIFEPFVTTKPNGTGLGLAITKRIVTAHHGSITVESFPGGTVFEVTLLAYNGEES
jgi:two-component system sensor histidine kinase AtoS